MKMILVNISVFVFFVVHVQVVCHEESNKSVCDICQCGYSSQTSVTTSVNCSHRDLNATSIPNTFPNTTEYLNLGFNSISYLNASTCTFRGLFGLHVLDLQYNHILKIKAGCFDDLKSLVELNLSYNWLNPGDLDPNIFLALSKLEILDINELYAESFPDKVLSALESLNFTIFVWYSSSI